MTTKTIITVSILFILALFAVPVKCTALPHVNTWQAVWDANTETDLAGYYLYWKPDGGEYDDVRRVFTAVNTQILNGVVPVGSLIVVTAIDLSGNESSFSNEVLFDVGTSDIIAPNPPTGLSIVPQQ